MEGGGARPARAADVERIAAIDGDRNRALRHRPCAAIDLGRGLPLHAQRHQNAGGLRGRGLLAQDRRDDIGGLLGREVPSLVDDLLSLARLEAPGAIDASPRLLLTGVILAAGWSSAITLLLTIAPEAKLRASLVWLMGELGGAGSYWPAPIAVPGLAAALVPLGRLLTGRLRRLTSAAERCEAKTGTA